MALVTVLTVVHGEPAVTVVDILHEPGTMYGAVRLEAAWPFRIPLHLLGILQLHTSAHVGGFGVPGPPLSHVPFSRALRDIYISVCACVRARARECVLVADAELSIDQH